MNKTATIKDIARALNISIATVSRALQGSTNIKPETKEKVLQLARELNYSPNPIALSLRDSKTKTIGIIVPEIANNFFSKTIAGIEDAAYARGYHVMICQSHEQLHLEQSLLKHMLQKRVDGMILSVSQQTASYEHIEQMSERKIPFVLFDRVMKEVDTNKVVVDDYTGSFEATQHLIDHGCRRIAHITMNKFLSITQNRMNGYKDAMKKNKLRVAAGFIRHCDFDIETAKKSVKDLFSGKQKPDALFVASERLALITLQVLHELKIKIPQQVAVVAFSDNPLSSFLQPSLTTVSQPCFEIGLQAANLLIDSIEQPNKPTMTVQLKTMLEVRGSSRRK
jgi:DNA-binding LacI/PurR family transcriptional regulator